MAANLLDKPDRGPAFFHSSVADYDTCAFFSESECGGSPDARTSSRDQRHFVGKHFCHQMLLRDPAAFWQPTQGGDNSESRSPDRRFYSQSLLVPIAEPTSANKSQVRA